MPCSRLREHVLAQPYEHGHAGVANATQGNSSFEVCLTTSVLLRFHAGKGPQFTTQERTLPWRVSEFRQKEQALADRLNEVHKKGGEPSFLRKRPVLRFVLVFALLLGGFNAFFYLYVTSTAFFDSYLGLNARIGGALLRIFGEEVTVEGFTISTPHFTLGIMRGCDALQASAFFAIGVLASPLRVPLRRRIVPIMIGTAGLLLLNIVRIVSLYYTGVYSRALFDVMHLSV